MTIVAELFDRAAQRYDQTRRQLVPGFDDFYGAVINLIPFQNSDRLNILDLGAGTGLLSALVAQAFPQAAITLVDISAQMLAQAQIRFADQPGRFHFQQMDYATSSLPGNMDVVISALSIHHLTDAQKRDTFAQIFQSLTAGGIFINADQILGPSQAIQQRYYDAWRQYVTHSGVSEADLSAALERMKEDKYARLDVQLDWLKAAGFQDVHCWYKNYSFVVYSGQKPGNSEMIW